MRNVYVLAAAQALAASGTFVVALLGGIIGAELAPRPEWATLPVSMGILGVAATTIPAAMLMQAIGRKRTFILGAVLAGLSALGIAWAVTQRDFALFCLTIFIMGANMACVQQYRFAAVEFVPVERTSVAISVVMCGVLFAAFAGPQLALAARHWIPGTEYAGSFVAVALLHLIGIVLLTRIETPPMRATRSDEPARPLTRIARQPQFLVAVLAGVCGYAVMSFIMTATPLSMHVVDGLSVVDTKWVIQSHLLAMFVPSLASGWLIARLGVKPMMSLGVVLMSLCIGIAALGSHHLMHYWWGLVLLGAGWNLLFVAGTTLLTTTYRASERFKAQAVNEFAVFGSQALASVLAGPAIQHLGWNALNLAGVPLLLAMAISLLALRRSSPVAATQAAAARGKS
ncbi:MAG TPA: MFS transporter [Steroidobacteraceae bacterium]|nr:MFS transporter [Steroidobacteraceae bacterium]